MSSPSLEQRVAALEKEISALKALRTKRVKDWRRMVGMFTDKPEMQELFAEAMEVLTLAETAAYLRVPEDAVLELVDKGVLPAQQIGGEWRFLKGVLVEFLRFGPHPSLAAESSFAKPGSKEAVLRHFGVFKDDADVEEQLTGIRVRREATGE